MKFLSQFLYILTFCALGELLQLWIPLPIPAAIYGIVLLLLALSTGLIKQEQVADAAQFLISVMGVFFVEPVVSVLEHWGLIAPQLVPICVIFVGSTFVVFGVSGLVTKLLTQKEETHA